MTSAANASGAARRRTVVEPASDAIPHADRIAALIYTMTNARPGIRALDTRGTKRTAVVGRIRAVLRPNAIRYGPSDQIRNTAAITATVFTSGRCRWRKRPIADRTITPGPSQPICSIGSIPSRPYAADAALALSQPYGFPSSSVAVSMPGGALRHKYRCVT